MIPHNVSTRPAKSLLVMVVSLVVFRNHGESRRCGASGATGWKRSGGRLFKVDPNHWTVFCRFLASKFPWISP